MNLYYSTSINHIVERERERENFEKRKIDSTRERGREREREREREIFNFFGLKVSYCQEHHQLSIKESVIHLLPKVLFLKRDSKDRVNRKRDSYHTNINISAFQE